MAQTLFVRRSIGVGGPVASRASGQAVRAEASPCAALESREHDVMARSVSPGGDMINY
jgi:hypothetical protein